MELLELNRLSRLIDPEVLAAQLLFLDIFESPVIDVVA